MTKEDLEQAADCAYEKEIDTHEHQAFIEGAQFVLDQQAKDKPDIYAGELNAERIKTYQKLSELYNISDTTVGAIFCKGADWALDIPHLNTQKEGWMSVDERLPEQGQVVLIWKKELVHPWTAKYQDGHFQSERDYCPGDRLLVFYYGVVTHWMPLPNPPSKP